MRTSVLGTGDLAAGIPAVRTDLRRAQPARASVDRMLGAAVKPGSDGVRDRPALGRGAR